MYVLCLVTPLFFYSGLLFSTSIPLSTLLFYIMYFLLFSFNSAFLVRIFSSPLRILYPSPLVYPFSVSFHFLPQQFFLELPSSLCKAWRSLCKTCGVSVSSFRVVYVALLSCISPYLYMSLLALSTLYLTLLLACRYMHRKQTNICTRFKPRPLYALFMSISLFFSLSFSFSLSLCSFSLRILSLCLYPLTYTSLPLSSRLTLSS